jgi:hypothetical protein
LGRTPGAGDTHPGEPSTRNLQDAGLLQDIAELIRQLDLEPTWLKVEVT